MKTNWIFTAKATRAKGAVSGELSLVIRADNREEAEQLVRDSVPGFDWSQWTSTWGVLPESWEIGSKEAEVMRGP